MAITLPYSTVNLEYGSTQWSSYTSTSTGTYYNYRTMDSQGYCTMNSFTRQNDGSILASIYVWAYSLITRTNTGYLTGAYTFQTIPLIQIHNQTLNSSITIYNASLTTSVGDATTGSITHASTVNVSIPASWFEPANQAWIFVTQQTVSCVNTGESVIHYKSETAFVVPYLYNVTVRYADALYPAKNIWVKYNDSLYVAKSLNVDYGGVIK